MLNYNFIVSKYIYILLLNFEKYNYLILYIKKVKESEFKDVFFCKSKIHP